MWDAPLLLLTATIWAYWIGVGVMIARVRRATRQAAGLLPPVRLERALWVLWLPVILGWIALPPLAMGREEGVLAIPQPGAASGLFFIGRLGASALGFLSFLLTLHSWKCMGKNWRMGVMPEQKTELVTSGLYARMRHPIYALSVLLVFCSAAVLPTPLMLAVALCHAGLMLLKARHEERFLHLAHGEVYARYCRRTGRFFPRLSGPGP